MSAPLTIGELAARTGLPTSTLRYYDRIGLIPATGRSGGQRRYDPKVIQRVRAVTLCQRSGFSLEEIGRLLDGGRPWQALARRKVEELQSRIAELEQTTALLRSALECGCRSLETCGRAAHLATLAGPAGPSLRTKTKEGLMTAASEALEPGIPADVRPMLLIEADHAQAVTFG